MKYLYTIAALVLFATMASAQVIAPDGEYLGGYPSRIVTPQGITHGATPDECRAAGYRDATAQEIADHEAAQAASAAAFEYERTLPELISTGIEVPYVVFLDATNREHGIALELTDEGDQIIYEFHASPVDFATVNSNRAAAMAKKAARKETAKNAKAQGGGVVALGARMDAIEALLGIE